MLPRATATFMVSGLRPSLLPLARPLGFPLQPRGKSGGDSAPQGHRQPSCHWPCTSPHPFTSLTTTHATPATRLPPPVGFAVARGRRISSLRFLTRTIGASTARFPLGAREHRFCGIPTPAIPDRWSGHARCQRHPTAGLLFPEGGRRAPASTGWRIGRWPPAHPHAGTQGAAGFAATAPGAHSPTPERPHRRISCTRRVCDLPLRPTTAPPRCSALRASHRMTLLLPLGSRSAGNPLAATKLACAFPTALAVRRCSGSLPSTPHERLAYPASRETLAALHPLRTSSSGRLWLPRSATVTPGSATLRYAALHCLSCQLPDWAARRWP
jgi:hypothetical protein